MSQEIKRAESLLETVKGQCREAKARADRKNQTIVNNYLDSARGNVEIISRIVQARQDSGDQDSRDFRTLKAYLAQAEDTYDVEVFDKPRTLVRGTLRASKSPDKLRTLVRRKIQGLFDVAAIYVAQKFGLLKGK